MADAVRDYLADYEDRGGKSPDATRTSFEAHVLPDLGNVAVLKLTREILRTWHRKLAKVPARIRSKKGDRKFKDTGADPEAPRRRRSSANRILTNLKAALNHARSEGKVTGPDDAWATVKPFREADKAKVRYLLDDEVVRLVNACPGDFRNLVTAALLTGCRYGELAALKVSDFDGNAQTVTIERSKGQKVRHIALTDEGARFFAGMSAGKSRSALLFERDHVIKQATRSEPAMTRRGRWSKSDQFRLVRDACAAANISPAITFHELRHTYGSRLAMKGVPMSVIAAQLGHADTRMTERHYAHLAPNYVAETVRANFAAFGIVPQSSITPMAPRRTARWRRVPGLTWFFRPAGRSLPLRPPTQPSRHD